MHLHFIGRPTAVMITQVVNFQPGMEQLAIHSRASGDDAESLPPISASELCFHVTQLQALSSEGEVAILAEPHHRKTHIRATRTALTIDRACPGPNARTGTVKALYSVSVVRRWQYHCLQIITVPNCRCIAGVRLIYNPKQYYYYRST